MIIPLSRPNLDKKEITSVTKTIYSGWITQGPKVEEFEENFSNYTGSKYVDKSIKSRPQDCIFRY